MKRYMWDVHILIGPLLLSNPTCMVRVRLQGIESVP